LYSIDPHDGNWVQVGRNLFELVSIKPLNIIAFLTMVSIRLESRRDTMNKHINHQTISSSMLALTCALFANSAIGAPTLTGISLAGAEFAADEIPGFHEYDYVFPTEAYINEFVVNQNMNTIRIPFQAT